MTFSQIDCNATFTCVAAVTLVSQMAFQQKVYRVVLQFEFAKREMRRVNSHASHFFQWSFFSQRRNDAVYHLHPKQLINVIFQTLQSHYSILKDVKHNFELLLGQKIHCPLGHCFSAENFPSSSPFRRAAFSDTRYTSVATFFYFNGSQRRRRGAA